MPDRQMLAESRPLVVSEADAESGRMLIQLITPGWGSTGYYSAEVLEAADRDRVFPAGTHMYLDHPTATEQVERPVRSVRDLAAVLTEDATWVEGALVAEARVFAPYREPLADMAEEIGVSIRGYAEGEMGEAEGRRGRIITHLEAGLSVDFVTHAGRGGRILEVLESARRTEVVERAVAHGVAEATANELRERLGQALRDAYGGEESWVWVRDFDDSSVWYEHETPDSSGVFQHSYTLSDDGAVALTGDPVEVRAEINYVPITPSEESTSGTTDSLSGTGPDGQAAQEAADSPPTPPEEDDMTGSTGAGGSAPLGPRQVIEAQLAEQRSEIAQMRARERGRDIVGEVLADAWLTPSVVARLTSEALVSLPIVNDTLDEAALRDRVTASRDRAESEAAEALQAAGLGRPRGLGAMTTAAGGDGVKLDERLDESFRRLGMSESAAGIAAKGR